MKVDNFVALSHVNKPRVDLQSKDDAKLKEQTDKFEAFFIKQILDISLKSDNSLFPKDAGDKIYKSMYNEAVSDNLSGSFGYSELLFNFLKENR